MKWKKKGAVFAIAIAVILLMATTMVLSSTEPNAEKVKLMPSEPQAEEVKLMPSEPITFPSERPATELKWTFMVYLDGDNNLEGAGIDDFMEMSSVSSTEGMNIVVQFDRIPGYSSAYDDWTTCKRFLVTPGMTPTAANATENISECNMGDPNTLRAFVDWAMAEYPADNYALILWDHGSGWKKKWVPWKDETGIARGICVDTTNGSAELSLQDLEQALTGKYVQLLGYDACLMHMIEVAYQMRAYAGIDVGSEETEPSDGWPYNTILGDLCGNPSMNPNTLGETIVSRYNDSYTFCDVTQSAVDKTKVSNLASAVDTLAKVLINRLNDPTCDYYDIQQARNEVEEFYYPDYIDLYHFAELIRSYVPNAGSAAQAVMDNVDNTVIAEAHGSCHPNAHGLSIYFPKEESDYLLSYGGTAFASDTQWNEFLEKYYEGPESCCAKTALYRARVPNPEEVLNPLRELRDKYLKEEYVDRYYDYSTELSMVMTKDPALAYEAARLLVKYSPMIGHHVTGTGKVKLITMSDVEEVVSFTDTLKSGVMKNSGKIDSMRSQGTIKFMDEFKEQVEASEGKTFSEALQSSIYCESEPMPDLVITNIRLDGNKVKYSIKNQGETATGGLFVNTLLVDGVPASEDLINRLIQPGQSLEKTFILSGPLKISPNTTIVVCADFKNKVHESDEENNCLVLE